MQPNNDGTRSLLLGSSRLREQESQRDPRLSNNTPKTTRTAMSRKLQQQLNRFVKDDSDHEEEDDDDDNNSIDLGSLAEGISEDFRRNHSMHRKKPHNDSLELLSAASECHHQRPSQKKPMLFSSSSSSSLDDYTDPTESSSSSFGSFYNDDEDDLEDLAVPRQVLRHPRHPHTHNYKRVCFGTVQVREYASTVGDHPFCKDSCPLTLDWTFVEHHQQDVETYECKRFLLRRPSPRKLEQEQRRERVKETCLVEEATLQEMEYHVSVERLKESMHMSWDNDEEEEDDDENIKTEEAGEDSVLFSFARLQEKENAQHPEERTDPPKEEVQNTSTTKTKRPHPRPPLELTTRKQAVRSKE